MIFLQSKDIARSIKKCRPHLIAVAYIGIDWKNFIDHENLDKIIISPTLGSNPYAIEELVKFVTWDKVFFLNNLHAKIYIGKKSAIIGSSNLTKNGLAESDGLLEAATKIKKSKTIKEITLYYEELENLANKMYLNEESKKERLLYLKTIWSKAYSHSIIKEKKRSDNSLINYEPLTNQDFYIAWYQEDDNYEYSSKIDPIEDFIEEEMHFLEEDKIFENKWILSWRITNKDKPHKTVKPTWIYINEIINKGIKSKDSYKYTKLAFSRTDREKPKAPFELTDEVIKAFKDIISKEKYKSFIYNHNDTDDFSINNTFKRFKQFIEDIKKHA